MTIPWWWLLAFVLALVTANAILGLLVKVLRVLSKSTEDYTQMLPKLLSQAGAIQRANSSDEAARTSVEAAQAHDFLAMQRSWQTQAIESQEAALEDAAALEEGGIPSELHLPTGPVVDLLTRAK